MIKYKLVLTAKYDLSLKIMRKTEETCKLRTFKPYKNLSEVLTNTKSSPLNCKNIFSIAHITK